MGEAINDFSCAVTANMAAFGLDLPSESIATLGKYYHLLLHWNARLHLVAPCTPQEFVIKHVLESLLLIKHFPSSAHVTDVGSGAGLPIIPCMIVRPDLETTLIESSQKKTVFLREAITRIGLARATIVCKSFEITPSPSSGYVTCRALDEFTRKVPALLKWAQHSTLLLFGGNSLREELIKAGAVINESLVPCSERRFLFLIEQ